MDGVNSLAQIQTGNSNLNQPLAEIEFKTHKAAHKIPYFGFLTGKEAVLYLKCAPERTYLIREKKVGQCFQAIFSLKTSEGVFHLTFEENKGHYILQNKSYHNFEEILTEFKRYFEAPLEKQQELLEHPANWSFYQNLQEIINQLKKEETGTYFFYKNNLYYLGEKRNINKFSITLTDNNQWEIDGNRYMNLTELIQGYQLTLPLQLNKFPSSGVSEETIIKLLKNQSEGAYFFSNIDSNSVHLYYKKKDKIHKLNLHFDQHSIFIVDRHDEFHSFLSFAQILNRIFKEKANPIDGYGDSA